MYIYLQDYCRVVARYMDYTIVLTADRTLMSEYGGAIFLGFSACVPRGLVPDSLYFRIFCPPVEANEDGSAVVAPNGTRKIEAALLEYGFKREDVIVAHPEHLDKVIGPRTKVLGITENDPLGIGPATTTFTEIFGGEAYMAVKFREILNHPAVRRYRPRIVVGGAGAWQLEDEGIRRSLGIDTVVIGEGEKVVGPLFEKAIRGEDLPGVVYGEVVEEDKIPVIRGATIDGIVEIARGCGRGCDFCEPTLQRFRCLSIDHILKEVEVNLRAGRQPLLHAEDVLRYKAKGLEINKQAVIDLFRSVKNYPGVKSVGISHFALASVVSAPDLVEEISSMLNLTSANWLSGQTGIETGSPRLVDMHMRGKCKPYSPKDWPDIVVRAFEILNENNWVPCATLILGLPGEEEKDVELTISLISKLKSFKSIIVPLFFVSMGGLRDRSKSFTIDDLTPRHAELLLKCWKHNFEWIEAIFKEWSGRSIRSRVIRESLKIIISYGIKQVLKYMSICEKDYNYDLRAMIRDLRSGNLKIEEPLPLRIIRPILK
ncbi:B12-binding domain-containing radical SAM protein [Candidatus Bathyarchaeota archaeon]|nr:B12-binding domain-containing radical SAM protein [Candidatus Bathyarchaeota archaeon]